MGKKKKAAAPEADAITTTEETAAETPAESATIEGENPKKRRRQKVTAMSGTATLADISAGYLAHMEDAGKSEGTVASYKMELKTAMAELGEEKLVGMLTADQVQEYFESR